MALSIEDLENEKTRLMAIKQQAQITIDAINLLLDMKRKYRPQPEKPISSERLDKNRKKRTDVTVRWKKEDIEKLKVNYKHQSTIEELAKLLGRSVGAITQRIIILKNKGEL